jgi:FkbM family methyltransferase
MRWMSDFISKPVYQKEQLEWVTYFLKKVVDQTIHPFQVFDIGANQGSLTDSMIRAINDYDYTIHAFDPNPLCYNFLMEKYKDNQRIKIYPDVVGETDSDSVAFNYSAQRSAVSYLYHSPVKSEISMITDWKIINQKQVAIDTVIDRSINTMFIKVDAEGHDFFVLKGCDWTLKNHRPFVLFEFSGKQNCEDYGYLPIHWYNFFQANDYDLIAPMGGKDLKFILANFNSYQPNFLDILAVPIEKKHILQ